jgi:CBS domain-containing protein
MPLRDAARLLRQAGVSGAPVVDGAGCCIGVLSAGDFLARAAGGDWPDRRWRGNPGCAHPVGRAAASETLPDGEAGRFMTADPVIAGPKTSIGDLARAMVDAHIHRVFVVDAAGRPVGVVASTDILAAVARAAGRPRTASAGA